MLKNNFRILSAIIQASTILACGIQTLKKPQRTKWAKSPFFSKRQYSQADFLDLNYALKYLNYPDKLEKSSLINLEILKGLRIHKIQALRSLLVALIESGRPKQNNFHRIKSNLKYYLLKMIALDECEEGQILWELGFEEYPMKILSNEASFRKPLFEIQSPSDYSCVSRNAYIALKKEAISEMVWKINYLEKTHRKKKLGFKKELLSKLSQDTSNFLL